MLTQEMLAMQQRMEKDEEMVSLQRHVLVQETDHLLAETDKVAGLEKELKQREAVLVKEASILQSENLELRKDNDWNKNRHSELCAEITQLKAKLSTEQGEKAIQEQKLAEQNGRSKHEADREAQLLALLDRERRQHQEFVQSLQADMMHEKSDHQTTIGNWKKDQEESSQREREIQDALERTGAEVERLQEEKERTKQENSRLQQEVNQVQRSLKDAESRLAQAAAQPVEAVQVPSGGSEGRLRALMSRHDASSDELREAIKSVEAFLDQATRELKAKELREKRAAMQGLYDSFDKGDERLIEEALEIARKAGLDSEDIAKGEEKLAALRSLTEEQKSANAAKKMENARKKDAFQLVKKDNVGDLQELLDNLDASVKWQDWRDYAGRTLLKCSQDLRSERVHPYLCERLGLNKSPENGAVRPTWKDAQNRFNNRQRSNSMISVDSKEGGSKPSSFQLPPQGDAAVAEATTPTGETLSLVTEDNSSPSDPSDQPSVAPTSEDAVERRMFSEAELEQIKTQAFRAVARNDEGLADLLEIVPLDIWSVWKNKAGKDLIELSQERGADLAYGVLAKALGLIQEMRRETFEEREDVWVFTPGDVQPRRATVLLDQLTVGEREEEGKEDPEDVDMIYIQYWDGNDDPVYVDRARIRKDAEHS